MAERRADDDVFTVHHKAVRHKELRRPTHSRRIVAITPVPSVPVRCVQVDNPDHLYLAGEAMVPTLIRRWPWTSCDRARSTTDSPVRCSRWK